MSQPTSAESNPQVALEQLAHAFQQSPEFGRKIKILVCQGNEDIRIFVEGSSLPDQKKYLPKVRKVLQQVRLKTPFPIQVYGRQLGDILPRWQTQLSPNMASSKTKAPNSASNLGSDWIEVSALLEWMRRSPISQQIQQLWSLRSGRWGAIALGGITFLLLVFLGSRGFSPSTSSDPMISPSQSYALQFDGKDDIAITSRREIPPFTSIPGGFSVAVWVNPTRYMKYPRILERSDNTRNDRMLLVVDHKAKGIRFSLNGNYAIAPGLPLKQWTHVVSTYDGQTIRIYLNGEMKGSVSYQGQIDLTRSNLMLGNNRENSRPYAGLIRDVQIWERTLSDAEVQQTMQAMPAKDAPGLLAAWSFDSVDTTIANDEVSQIPLIFKTTAGLGNGPKVVEP
ncbi:MAG: LamG domain-containing protein [Sphaerospermopsis sp. SIO1G1]|nr:LamG domain-containing protein [Sphaerospermopsis sp. SIO1G1]